MKTRSLIAALAATLLVGCASPATHKVEPAFVSVHLLGDHAFCVYDLSWKIEGLRYAPGEGPSRPESCTPAAANRKGLFAAAATGGYYVALLPTHLDVHFRREMDGPLKTARFDLAALPVPDGYRALGITPYITPTGAMLWLYVTERKDQQKGKLLKLPEVADE